MISLDFDRQEVNKQLATKSLYHFVRQAWETIETTQFIDNWHIQMICEHLQAVTEGQIKNLLVNVPPGSSKSLITCVFWPCWEWATCPERRWFFASYDQKLSSRDSVRSRYLIKSEWYNTFWPSKVVLTNDQNQKVYYETSAGGYRLSTTVRGHGVGEHPDRIVTDDPHNVRQAESEKERQSVLDWEDLTVSTRGVSRGVRRATIMQRLHHKDLSGHLLEKGGWVHLKIPMRYDPARVVFTPLPSRDPRTEPGELMAPKQFPEEAVAEMEKNLGPYGTASQLQQEPSPREGGLFKEHYFNKTVRNSPYDCRRIRFWDRAASLTGKRTAGTLMAVDQEGYYYVEHVHKGKWDPKERNDQIVMIAKRDRIKYGPKNEPLITVEGERGSTGKESFQHLARRLSQELPGIRVKEDLPSGDKYTRAVPLADQLSAGNVYIVDGGHREGTGTPDWDVQGFIKELCMFPSGEYADQVDSSSGAFNLLSGRKVNRVLQIHKIDSQKREALTVACFTPEDLIELDTHDRSLLVHVHDPLRPDTLPPHNLHSVIETLTLAFAPIEPHDHRPTWDQPLQPYGVPARDVMMTPDHGKKLWSFLLRKRQLNPRIIVIVAENDVSLSISQAISDVLSIPRVMIFMGAEGDPEGAPPNRHVYDTTKVSRAKVG